MGFQELSKFNDSLLAKQIWRLKTCENKLLHKVFKAKIFPDCLIMECTNPNKGLYAWRRLLQARYVIEVGVVWRLGDGRSTFIRTDKWLPKNPAMMIVSPPAVLPLDSRVSELINEATHTWKSDLVRSEFLAHEVDMVLGIPLGCRSIYPRQTGMVSHKK